ncbi:type II secretion system F family protein [Acidicapsa ligni]|uniref:type II secretion system F family protein n=1 Tax=Acidicapsa ligni TaxID=542300 RepID=UPI0021E0B5D3|nr:type II secretion system F family protein [Acidicapsa ligni]
MLQILFIAALGITAFCVAGLVVIPVLLRPGKEAQRAMEIVKSDRPDSRVISAKERFEDGLLNIAHDVRTRLGLTISAKSIERLAAAGYRNASAPDFFFAAQCLTPLAALFGGSFMPHDTLFWVFIFGALGYLAPGIWLSEKAKRRRERIRRSLPDTIDLLVICVDAGLGLDQALLRTTEEIVRNHPDLQEELTRVHLEQRAGRPRLETWQNLSDRAKVPELSAFVSMLTQADRFGTPIAKTLSTFADDIRMKRRQRIEEIAAKTKVKIIFPLVFFIFPCLFIVLLGPAYLTILGGLKGLAK